MIYGTAQALRSALEHRLLAISTETGIALDRLHRRVIFERIVARLQARESGRWVLKGGMALEVRLGGGARLTKDLDLGLRDEVLDPADLYERLVGALSVDPDGDYLVLTVGPPVQLREDGGGHVTWRVSVSTYMADKPFGRIRLDISPRAYELDMTEKSPCRTRSTSPESQFESLRSSMSIAMPRRNSMRCCVTSATARTRASVISSTL